MKAYLFAGVAAAAIALSAPIASADTLVFEGQGPVASLTPIAPDPISSLNAPIVSSGGYWNPWGANADEPWINIINVGSATFAAPSGVFSFVWGSPNPGNYVTTSDGSTFSTSDLPNWVANAPLGYLVEIQGAFTSVTLGMSGGDGGNFEVGIPSGVPEASTWAMMGLGFAGLAFAGYRSRRSPVAAAL